MRRVTVVAMGLVAALAFAPATLAAPTYTVSGPGDGAGSCNPSTLQCTTLRAAVTAADVTANAGATIKLGAQTYKLNSGATCGTTLGELRITQSMTIDGTGQGGSAGTTIQQADGCNRVLEIDPSAAASVTISGLDVTGGTLHGSDGGGILIDGSSPSLVTLQNVELTGNTATGPSATGMSGGSGDGAYGGGVAVIAANTSLTLTGKSVVSSNTVTAGAGAANGNGTGNGGAGGDADGGGVYYSGGGTLTVSASTVKRNTATAGGAGGSSGAHSGGSGGDADGGGIGSNATGGTMVLDSSVSNNAAIGRPGGSDASGTGGYGGYGLGGGVELDGAAKLVDDTISDNQAFGAISGTGTSSDSDGGARGGGIDVASNSVTIDASTVTGNIATGSGDQSGTGGGVDANAGYTGLAVVNSTLFDNTAEPDQADLGESGGSGGGLYVYSPITLASDTIDANHADGTNGDGGDLSAGNSSPIRVTSTIVAGGTAGTSGNSNCDATVDDLSPGHNLEDDQGDQCAFAPADGDQVGVNPRLAGALVFNGGPTRTLALAAGSPSIGKGGACIDPTSTPPDQPLRLDQRGDPRPAGCDIGAFQSEPPINTTAPSVEAQPDQTLICAVGTWSGDGLYFAYAWLLNGTAISGATGFSYKVIAADVGKHLACRVTAIGNYGSSQATSAATTVQLPAPTLSHAGESHRSWRESGRGKHKPPIGTKFTFTLNESATVTLSFKHQGRGRKVKGTLIVKGRGGKNKVSFHGSLPHGHRLAPGKYAVTFRASNTAGRSRPHTLKFTIVKK